MRVYTYGGAGALEKGYTFLVVRSTIFQFDVESITWINNRSQSSSIERIIPLRNRTTLSSGKKKSLQSFFFFTILMS